MGALMNQMLPVEIVVAFRKDWKCSCVGRYWRYLGKSERHIWQTHRDQEVLSGFNVAKATGGELPANEIWKQFSLNWCMNRNTRISFRVSFIPNMKRFGLWELDDQCGLSGPCINHWRRKSSFSIFPLELHLLCHTGSWDVARSTHLCLSN